MIWLIVVLCLCVFWLWYNRSSELEPPVISGALPIVGHTFMGESNGVATYKLIQRMSEESMEKGGVFRAYFGPMTVYGITDPDDALTVANLCLDKSFTYRVGEPLLKRGLVTAPLDIWKRHRKLLDPVFNYQSLVGLLGVFNNQARRLVANLAKEEGKMFDHEILIRINSLETICITSFGADAQEFGKLQENYIPSWNILRDISAERLTKMWLLSDFIFNLTPKKKEQDRHTDSMMKLADSIIQTKVNGMNHVEDTESNDEHIKKFILTLLKAANEGKLTQEEVRSEIDTMIGAGHETTASTVSFALTHLGSLPEAQEKAYKEIIKVIGDSDREIVKEDLAQLTYLEAIIKETLRLYPIIPVIGRRTDRDVKLKNCTLKANRSCFLALHGVLRDKMWGPDRHEFRPDRWFEKDTLPDQKYFAAFCPGRRFCIGKTFAMMSIKVTLARVLRQFKVTSDSSKMVISLNLVIRPDSGHYIKIEKRDKAIQNTQT